MPYWFRYQRYVSRVISSQKGKPPVHHYHQGKVFIYFHESFHLI